MPARIFISYRRDDVAGDTRGIRDGLAARFGRGSVFMDVDDLLAGQRFDEGLAKALDACDVLIAVIGPRWMDLLRAKMSSSEPDFVRAEIAEALRRRIAVIPVRVGREGQMPALPRPEVLPEDLRDLVLHQKHDVAHERFGRDLADLAQAIGDVRKMLRPQRSIRVSWAWAGAAALGIVAVGGAAAYIAGMGRPGGIVDPPKLDFSRVDAGAGRRPPAARLPPQTADDWVVPPETPPASAGGADDWVVPAETPPAGTGPGTDPPDLDFSALVPGKPSGALWHVGHDNGFDAEFPGNPKYSTERLKFGANGPIATQHRYVLEHDKSWFAAATFIYPTAYSGEAKVRIQSALDGLASDLVGGKWKTVNWLERQGLLAAEATGTRDGQDLRVYFTWKGQQMFMLSCIGYAGTCHSDDASRFIHSLRVLR